MKIVKNLLAAALVVGASSAAMAANIVTNGSFESGIAGWTGNMSSFEYAPYAHSGTNLTGTGCVGTSCVSTLGQGSYFGQTLNTTAGSQYTLSFWVGENGGPNSAFSVFWGGAKIAEVYNPANRSLTNGTGMLQFSFSDLAATGSSTYFEVHGMQNPAGIYFDDFSVENHTQVPEPASLALIGLGLAGFALSRRRKQA